MSWWIEYNKYLKSSEWKTFKESYYLRYGKRCVICKSTVGIVLHHHQYSNFRSRDPDLYSALCKVHHDRLTRESRTPAKRRGMTLQEFTFYFIKRERSKRK